MKKNILIFNGSPSGSKGNCAIWIRHLLQYLKSKATVTVVNLSDDDFKSGLKQKMGDADGFVFVTGTYWDSWGSPLQKLLEDSTELEGTKIVMGKPASVFVLMHSVGGKSVVSRLQGVLSTFGFLLPPMSGMVYSLVNDIALKSGNSFADDFWHKEDAFLVLENLLLATQNSITWNVWPVDKKNPRRKWLKIGTAL